jgi:hypothetical protein
MFPAYPRQACLVSVIPGSMALSATRVIEGSEGRRSFYEYGQRQKGSLKRNHLGVTSRMTKVQQNSMNMMNANCFINRDSMASPLGERDSMLIAF